MTNPSSPDQEPTDGTQRPVDLPDGPFWLSMNPEDFGRPLRHVQSSLFQRPDECRTLDLFDSATDAELLIATDHRQEHYAPAAAVDAEPCATCDADDQDVCGCCPACDTTMLERCVACGLCRCDRHDDCTRAQAAARAAAEVLAAVHTAATRNEYGSCDGAGFVSAPGNEDRARVHHQLPRVDLTDPDRMSSTERWEEQRARVTEYADTLEAAGFTVVQRTVSSGPIALAVPPKEYGTAQRIAIGARVAGTVQGQAYTGTVTNTGYRDGSSVLRDGRLVTLDAGTLVHVHVATGNELTTPAGRRVKGVHLRGAEEIAGLVVLVPVAAGAAEDTSR